MKATLLLFTAAVLLGMLAPGAAAQCLPIDPGNCINRTGIPTDYSMFVNIPYWVVVQVAPEEPDDKDIVVYTACPASGSSVGSSTGTNGTDFVIGDFNHNPVGTFFPRVVYGSTTEAYTVSWHPVDGEIFPVSLGRVFRIGGYMGTCDHIRVYDVYLESGRTYEFRFSDPSWDAYVALFRNPTSTSYWAGRNASEFELTGLATYQYTAPATDWYGIVVFPRWRELSSDVASLDVELLYDCRPLTDGVCTSEVLYELTGPKDNYKFEQTAGYWAAVAVASDVGENTNLAMYTQCDQNGSFLTSTGGYYGDTGVIVGDFNHNPPGMYYPVLIGKEFTWHTIEWEGGADIFSVGTPPLYGVMGGVGGDCNLVSIYDVYLVANTSYRFNFDKDGAADVRLALFRNPGSGQYWTQNLNSAWTLSAPNTYALYTAPQTDWYGLAVWANERGEEGWYSVNAELLGDCYELPSGECQTHESYPSDYAYQSLGYWSVVGVVPDEGDDKDIEVWTACDGDGTLLANSVEMEGADFVVGDFNHNADGEYYARVSYGSYESEYLVQCDTGHEPGEDILPHNFLVEGIVGGDACSYFKIWDVYLEAGHTYMVGFTRSGSADVRCAFFRNPTSSTFWVGRDSAVWEMPGSGDVWYTAPATDWYAVVVFANRRHEPGTYTLRLVDQLTTAVDPPRTPDHFALHQNTPNPFNPVTTVRYDVPAEGGHVSIAIYDVGGRLVRALRDGVDTPGEKSLVWDGRNDRGQAVATGVYFCRMQTTGYSNTIKMVMTK